MIKMFDDNYGNSNKNNNGKKNSNSNSDKASEYSGMIQKYAAVKAKIQSLLPYFDDCVSSITNGIDYTKRIIINSNPIDGGELNNISTSVSSCRDSLNAIISECNKEIGRYTALYNDALNNN